jgi:hypothetical protein
VRGVLSGRTPSYVAVPVRRTYSLRRGYALRRSATRAVLWYGSAVPGARALPTHPTELRHRPLPGTVRAPAHLLLRALTVTDIRAVSHHDMVLPFPSTTGRSRRAVCARSAHVVPRSLGVLSYAHFRYCAPA